MTRSALIALAVLGIAAVALAAYAHTARPPYSPSTWPAPAGHPCSCPSCSGGAMPTAAAQPPASPMVHHAASHHRVPHFHRCYRHHPAASMTEVEGTVEGFQPPSMLVVRTVNGTTIIVRVPPTMVDEDAHMTYMPLLLSRLATKGATVDLLLFRPNPTHPTYIAAKITIGGHTYYAPHYVAYKLAQGNTP